MKYEITYTCGHAGVVDITGPTKERPYWINRASAKLCPECQARQDAENLVKVREKWERLGYPALKGSDKQILWADSIRDKSIEEARKELNRCIAYYGEHPEMLTEEGQLFMDNREKCLMLALSDVTSASAWINENVTVYRQMGIVWNTRKDQIVN